MTNSSSLPSYFRHIYDSIIRHVWEHETLSSDVTELTDWFESDGLDLIVDSWINDEMVVNLKTISKEIFRDAELMRERSVSVVSNADRFSYGLEQIKRCVESNDGYAVPSVHCIKLNGHNEQSVVIGYLLEIHGQEGSVPTFMGFYKSRADFLDFLRGQDYWPVSELHNIPESTILSLWNIE